MPEALHSLFELYREHGGPVHDTARALCGSARADDVTEDVFVDFWRHPETFLPTNGTLRAFLVAGSRRRALRMTESQMPPASRLGALSAVDRDAVIVIYYGACSLTEAAVVLGERPEVLACRVRSGLRRLHQDLEVAQSTIRTSRQLGAGLDRGEVVES